MSTVITFPEPDGADYVIPAVGDENWGQNVTDFLVAIPTGVPPRSGLFTLTGDLSFGTGFGLLSKYFTSITANAASAGLVRLAKTDSIDWRNNANSGNLALAINGSDQLTFNGSIIPTGGSTIVSSITGTTNQIVASASTGAVTLSTPQNIDTAANVVFGTMLLSGPPGQLLLGNGSSNVGGLSLRGTSTNTVSLLAPNSVTSYTMKLPGTQGAANSLLLNDGSGNLSFSTGSGAFVSSITGTSNEIIASASTGAITLSTPQAIGTGSSPTFLSLTTTQSVNANQHVSAGQQAGVTGFLGLVGTTSGAVAITVQDAAGTYSMALPSTQGSGGQVLTVDTNAGSQSNLKWANSAGSGTVNSGTSTHLAYYATSTNAVSDASGATISGTYTLSGAVTHSATLTMSGATIAMGSNKITGLASGTTSGDALAFGQSFTANTITFSPTTAGIKGTTTNDNTVTGNVGEYVESVVGFATAPGATGTLGDATSISLTAGDWDITFTATAGAASATTTTVAIGISTTSGNSATGLVAGSNFTGDVTAPTIAVNNWYCVPSYRISLSGTTTVYAKVRYNFTGTAPQIAVRLSARRVR